MMHATSESDVTSLAASSSPASPKRPVYYVQSPSRDSSGETDKCSASTQATPIFPSPTESPSHPSSYARHSLASSGSRISGIWRGNKRRGNKDWQECNAIEEEVDYEYYYGRKGYSRGCQRLIVFTWFCAAFAAFCLIIWGVSRPYKAEINVKSLTVHSFYFGEGSDRTGVPTKLLTVNCTTSMVIYNPARFFGIHVSSKPINLMYSEITVADGQLRGFYQPRKSERFTSVTLDGQRVPLYGAGVALAASDGSGGIPLKLDFEIQSRGYLVGRLVKTKHQRHISCSLIIKSGSTKEVKFKPDSCTYD